MMFILLIIFLINNFLFVDVLVLDPRYEGICPSNEYEIGQYSATPCAAGWLKKYIYIKIKL